jgi:methylenetetrahydrofolate--tRNA-(uracil-5-)-methyltransferase
MNANFGILKEMPVRIKDKKERYTAIAERALEALDLVKRLEKLNTETVEA